MEATGSMTHATEYAYNNDYIYDYLQNVTDYNGLQL